MSDPNFLLYGILAMMWGVFLAGSLLTYLSKDSYSKEGWTIAMAILFILSIIATWLAWMHINHIDLNAR